MVESAEPYKLLVVALLDYCTVLYHENGVGILDGRKSVRNYKAGLVFHKLGHRGLYLYLGTRVDIRGRLVENKYGRFREECARDGYKLLLSL
jgi:hypothetical protein